METQLAIGSNMINAISSENSFHSDFSNAVLKISCEMSDYEKQLKLFSNEIKEYDNTLLTENPKFSQILNDSQQIINDKIQTFNNFFTMYQNFKTVVIDEHLKRWQRNQALAGNGVPFRDNLDDIQACIENLLNMSTILIEIYKSLRIIISKLCLDERYTQELDQVSITIEKIKQSIILSAFVVEKQPPQVIKTNFRFKTIIRWLIGPQFDIYKNNPQVKCIILSEDQVQRFHDANHQIDPTPESAGVLECNIGDMEYNNSISNRHFVVNFRRMIIRKISRKDQKSYDAIAEAKYALLFYTTADFHNNGNISKITAWTLSLPVVVIIRPNQEPFSLAIITWVNAFSDIITNPFQVAERVTWTDLSQVLNTKFFSKTARQLTPENLNFLCEKLCSNNDTNSENDYVTWRQFCKDPLTNEHCFTFWEWFYFTMKLTKEFMLLPWQKGYINGYISKINAIEILRECPEGTFLIRFPGSLISAVTVGVKSNGDILMLEPWTARDLNILSLSDRIINLSVLKYLYQGPSFYIPKEEAFFEFCSNREMMDFNHNV